MHITIAKVIISGIVWHYHDIDSAKTGHQDKLVHLAFMP
jgi:hypothetical protein